MVEFSYGTVTKTLKEAAAVCGGVLLCSYYQDLEGGCSCLWWSSPMELLPRP